MGLLQLGLDSSNYDRGGGDFIFLVELSDISVKICVSADKTVIT